MRKPEGEIPELLISNQERVDGERFELICSTSDLHDGFFQLVDMMKMLRQRDLKSFSNSWISLI